MPNCSRLVYNSLRFLNVSKYSPSWRSVSGCQTDERAANKMIVDCLTSRICWGRRCRAQAATSSQTRQRRRAVGEGKKNEQIGVTQTNSSSGESLLPRVSHRLVHGQLFYQAAVTFGDSMAPLWQRCFWTRRQWELVLCGNAAVMRKSISSK